MEKLLKLPEAAKILGISVWTLRHGLIKTGRIAVVDVGSGDRSNPRIAPEDLAAFIAARRRRATK